MWPCTTSSNSHAQQFSYGLWHGQYIITSVASVFFYVSIYSLVMQLRYYRLEDSMHNVFLICLEHGPKHTC